MALTKRYVRADAAGGGDGTTDANSGANGAFTFDEMITDIDTPHPGYKYLLKSGTYSRSASDTPTGDGTTSSPIIIEGFNTTEGDLLSNGRDANGDLDTTNFPLITYSSPYRLAMNGSLNSVLRCLHVTGGASTNTVVIGAGSTISQCRVENTGTGVAIDSSVATSAVIKNCDAIANTASATAAIQCQGATSIVIGNKCKCASGSGIVTRNTVTLAQNTIYESAIGIQIDATNAQCNIINNTIANCTGDGIQFTTGTTTAVTIIGNHITGSGGYGINYQTSTCVKQLGGNRFRDNTSGPINGGGDWEEGTSINNVTSDDTDAIDFADQANDNYSLLNTAPAITAGVGYRNPIGAHGASSFGAGGGGPLIGGRLVR